MQVDSLPAEPQGKPKKTGVGSLIPSPADLTDVGIELGSPALQADSLPTVLSGKPYRGTVVKIYIYIYMCVCVTTMLTGMLHLSDHS